MLPKAIKLQEKEGKGEKTDQIPVCQRKSSEKKTQQRRRKEKRGEKTFNSFPKPHPKREKIMERREREFTNGIRGECII